MLLSWGAPDVCADFMSTAHPDYEDLEGIFTSFCLSRTRRRRRDTQGGRAPLEDLPYLPVLDLLERVMTLERARDDLQRGKDDESVFRVLEALGLAALRPEKFERLQPWECDLSAFERDLREREAQSLDSIRTMVWDRLNRLYQSARSSPFRKIRRSSARSWHRVGSIMGGSQKGTRPDDLLDPLAVCQRYAVLLFRLLRARQLLDTCPKEGTASSRVDRISTICGLDPQLLRDFLGVDLPDTPIARPETFARMQTAVEFGISDKRVGNLVSETRRRVSRRSTGKLRDS